MAGVMALPIAPLSAYAATRNVVDLLGWNGEILMFQEGGDFRGYCRISI